ncbi:MAG: hypothetical protein AAF840_11125, partial [Bacteroidota bacterium]
KNFLPDGTGPEFPGIKSNVKESFLELLKDEWSQMGLDSAKVEAVVKKIKWRRIYDGLSLLEEFPSLRIRNISSDGFGRRYFTDKERGRIDFKQVFFPFYRFFQGKFEASDINIDEVEESIFLVHQGKNLKIDFGTLPLLNEVVSRLESEGAFDYELYTRFPDQADASWIYRFTRDHKDRLEDILGIKFYQVKL